MYTRHLNATQALARVRVALPRGPECPVVSTWVRAIYTPFLPIFFNVLNQLKIENKLN